MVDVKPVKLGRNERMSFGKIDEVIQMPHLLDIQRKSYQWFLEEGLREVFKDVSGITDYTGNLVLDFMDYELDVDKPNYSVIECKERDATYSAALRVTARLLNKETGEIKESNVFMGDFPLMTDSGTFVINGAERVIVSQLVRSPGVYYKMDRDDRYLMGDVTEKKTLSPGESVDIPLPMRQAHFVSLVGVLPPESQVISRWTVTYYLSDGSGGSGEREVAA